MGCPFGSIRLSRSSGHDSRNRVAIKTRVKNQIEIRLDAIYTPQSYIYIYIYDVVVVVESSSRRDSLSVYGGGEASQQT